MNKRIISALQNYYKECCKCGRKDNLTIDHIIPRNLGGSDNILNLQVLCIYCNSKKGSKGYCDYRAEYYKRREILEKNKREVSKILTEASLIE